VTEQAGLKIFSPGTGVPLAKSLGLNFYDFDEDGYLDIFITNDTVQNLLFRNQQDGTFNEIAWMEMPAVQWESTSPPSGTMTLWGLPLETLPMK